MSIKKKINIAIIGATGYTGLDLILMLSRHPRVEIKYLCASKNIGKKIQFFDKRIKKKLPIVTSIKKIDLHNLDLIFLSLPNGEAQKIIKSYYKKNLRLKFIDLSADFRIFDTKSYQRIYRIQHKAKELIKDSLYSIPEFSKNEIRNYRIIANPGCYPTSIQIPLLPLLQKNLINYKNITIDSKSGFSGAGKNLEKKFKHKNLYSSTFGYKPKNHRHIFETKQQMAKFTKKKINFIFNPHLLPTFRGILSSIYVSSRKGKTINFLRNFLNNHYKKNNFIKILKVNTPLGSGNVLNSNNCEISICESGIKNKFIIFSAIDNLVKGASGQAIQNMNIMFNFPEDLGLK